MTTEPTQLSELWEDDVLNRRPLADFLTASLNDEAKNLELTKAIGLTVSLDADWGTGKSFFVRHWADDLRAKNHPVVLFDAWENDLGDTASIALMSCIREELSRWEERLPRDTRVRRNFNRAKTSAIQNLRRIVVPATKVIAKGLISKATGVAVGELLDIANSNDALNAYHELSKGTIASVEKGLDTVFKGTLDDHLKRTEAIHSFRSSLSELIQLFQDKADAASPMYVFVDEVDRCRPSYAIQLLEEIKHIFGAPKTCFVVSMNHAQLKESVKAVYGSGFDGHRYLMRFFYRRYKLPLPIYDNYSSLLTSEYPNFSARSFITGLPPDGDEPDKSLKNSLNVITESFDLDLRSTRQIFLNAVSIASGISPKFSIFSLWLFFLAATEYKKPEDFDELTSTPLDAKAFNAVCRKILVKDVDLTYSVRNEDTGVFSSRTIKLSDIVWRYYSWSHQKLMDISKQANSRNSYEYPENTVFPVAAEMPKTYPPDKLWRPSIADYAQLVKYVGLIIS